MTPRFSGSSIFPNILAILPILLLMLNQFIWKTSVATMATLIWERHSWYLGVGKWSLQGLPYGHGWEQQTLQLRWGAQYAWDIGWWSDINKRWRPQGMHWWCDGQETVFIYSVLYLDDLQSYIMQPFNGYLSVMDVGWVYCGCQYAAKSWPDLTSQWPVQHWIPIWFFLVNIWLPGFWCVQYSHKFS